MAFNQGIDFRSTSTFVMDPSHCDYENSGNFGPNYPRTPRTGDSTGVGWESFDNVANAEVTLHDINAANDARVAGFNSVFSGTNNFGIYRIDLPASGTYTITIAISGDAYLELFDTTTSLGVLANTSNVTTTEFVDATNVTRTSASDWVTNNATASATFSTTVCRFKVGHGSALAGSTHLAHVFVQGAASAPATPQTGWMSGFGYFERRGEEVISY